MKSQLLQLIKDVPARKEDVMRAVIYSGLMPEVTLSHWMNDAVERAIRAAQGLSDVPFWEVWASKWLSGEDRTAESAKEASKSVQNSMDAHFSQANRCWGALSSAWAAYEASYKHPSIINALCSNTETCEVVREQLYNDMMKLISEMGE